MQTLSLQLLARSRPLRPGHQSGGGHALLREHLSQVRQPVGRRPWPAILVARAYSIRRQRARYHWRDQALTARRSAATCRCISGRWRRIGMPSASSNRPPAVPTGAGRGSVLGWTNNAPYTITGEFGQSDGPYPGSGHVGMDIGTPSGTPITAAQGGTIVHAGGDYNKGNYGNSGRHANGRQPSRHPRPSEPGRDAGWSAGGAWRRAGPLRFDRRNRLGHTFISRCVTQLAARSTRAPTFRGSRCRSQPPCGRSTKKNGSSAKRPRRRLGPSFDYGNIGGELQQRFGWLGTERGPFGMPRRLGVGPLSVPNPLTAPSDIIGTAGAVLNTVSDAVIEAGHWPAADRCSCPGHPLRHGAQGGAGYRGSRLTSARSNPWPRYRASAPICSAVTRPWAR